MDNDSPGPRHEKIENMRSRENFLPVFSFLETGAQP
jgi:hypothetical protein